jgi:hypothetical protein
VARAKRTDRAEARRRYRATAAEQQASDADSSDEPDESTVRDGVRPERATRGQQSERSARGSQGAQPPDGPTPRGLGQAFRGAYRPANFREDFAYLPSLLRSRAIWPPALVSIASAIAIIVSGGNEPISKLLAQFFLVPPPIGAIFIAGFFAPRASYLAGAIAGLVGALSFIAAVSAVLPSVLTPGGVQPSASPSVIVSSASPGTSSPALSPSPTTGPSASAGSSPSPTASPARQVPVTEVNVGQAAGYWIGLSLLAGALFGAAAAWYRRFLRLSNAGRPKPPQRQQRPARRR